MGGSPEQGTTEDVHATCVVIGETGILIRGPSGSGKSTLARELVETAGMHGRFAALVADDRVRLRVRHGRLVAEGFAATAGLVEIRGLGLVRRFVEPRAVIRLVVDCHMMPERMPTQEESTTVVAGIALPRIAIRNGSGQAGLVLARLGGFGATIVTE